LPGFEAQEETKEKVTPTLDLFVVPDRTATTAAPLQRRRSENDFSEKAKMLFERAEGE